MLRVFEAFSGVGSQRMALRNIGVEHEVVAIAEIDKYAIKSYEAIHGKTNNVGDISKLTLEQIPDHDLFTYSFPCQDISNAGKMKGLSEGSGTRSSLLWECKRVIEGKKPKFLLLENVKNLVGKKNKPDFDKWLQWLESQGYTNYWKILNAKNHGIPQNRERVFVVSILGNHDIYDFPYDAPLNLYLKDLLEKEIDEKYYLSEDVQSYFVYHSLESEQKGNGFRFEPHNKEYSHIAKTITTRAGSRMDDNFIGVFDTTESKMKFDSKTPTMLIKNATKQGYLEAKDGDGIDLAFPDSKTRRGRVQKGMSQTLTTSDNLGVLEGFRIRKLTPLECWRLMGFSDEDFNAAKAAGISDTQLYKQAGNSIVVNVLENILHNLLIKN